MNLPIAIQEQRRQLSDFALDLVVAGELANSSQNFQLLINANRD
jgi:hypothetical protein